MPDDFMDIVSHLSDSARTSLFHANLLAGSFGSQFIGTEHLLLGILAQGSSAGAKILLENGVTLEGAQSTLKMVPVSIVINSEAKNLSEMAKLTLKMGWDVAKGYNQEHIGTEHILFSMLQQKNSRALVLLDDMSVDINGIMSSLDDYFDQTEIEQDTKSQKSSRQSHSSGMLELYGIDLTERARKGELDPVIGRNNEEERLVTILCRRTKNNPILIGEPGVGKTAIVEGLAIRVANDSVPEILSGKRLIQLDLSSMIAGTKYRGEFEDRLKRTIEELRRQKDVLLFIDEVHLIVGAGAAEGTIDAANMLKPALARGEIRLIGATTIDEYRKYIEKDSALERRLQTIIVSEPSIKDTVEIIKGLKSKYEIFHHMTISDQTIKDAVYMADRYINDRFMPDKAIDVIDEAAALIKVRRTGSSAKLRGLRKQLNDYNEKIEEAVLNQNYEQAAILKTKVSQIEFKIKEIASSEKPVVSEITSQDIARSISLISGIPVSRLQKSEQKLYSNLEVHLSKYIIGQTEAIIAVSKAIRRSRSGISNEQRPIGSFVFMGPTGVGKTELARVIAREVFGNDKSLIKIDMSEFSEKHTASRLVGAPAGYIGYDDGGQLTDKIRRQPYSVVLFDEIEKAHPSVFNLLLQILEDGKLTDAKGKGVSFRNAIIILTSNLGSEYMARESSLGFSTKSKVDQIELKKIHDENAISARGALSKIMRPELINRFDAILTFNALTKAQISKVFDILIEDLQKRLVSKGIHLSIEASAKKLLIKHGYDDKHGARPLRRTIQDELETIIADGILLGKYNRGDVLNVTTKDGEIKIDVANEK